MTNKTGGKRMNSLNTSSEVDKKAFEQLSGVLERMYYDVKKGLSDLRPYERQIKAIFRKRQDYETHQSEIKGRIDVLQLQRGVMGKYKGDGVFDKKYFELVEIEINNLTESLNQMKGKSNE